MGREVDSDQSHNGGHDQRGADAFQERPSEYQDAEVWRKSGRERSGSIDHAANRESASTTDNGPDLASGEHQGCHHECVERDSCLDPGNRRANIVSNRRNRHVHDRTVQGHEELC